MSCNIKVHNEIDNKPAKGGKNMKKILFMLIVFLALIMASVLYGTHNLIIEERETEPLEQAMAYYPETLPTMMSDQMTALSF